jgi:hypothetical protein
VLFPPCGGTCKHRAMQASTVEASWMGWTLSAGLGMNTSVALAQGGGATLALNDQRTNSRSLGTSPFHSAFSVMRCNP